MTQREFEIGFCHKRTSVCTGFFIDENHLITRLDSKTRRKKGGTGLSPKEKEMVARVKQMWYNFNNNS